MPMTMNKCFTSIFTGPLTKEGFVRKGVLYYRLCGEIMQGVMLKTINPFSVCVNMCPWWTYGLMGYDADDLTRGYWTEHGININGFYYRKTEPEENDAAMRQCLDVPRALYEQGAAEMRELLRTYWKIEV